MCIYVMNGCLNTLNFIRAGYMTHFLLSTKCLLRWFTIGRLVLCMSVGKINFYRRFFVLAHSHPSTALSPASGRRGVLGFFFRRKSL